MNAGILIMFVGLAVCALFVGICIGVLLEDISLRRWFNKRIDDIENQYKRKSGEDGTDNEKP